MTTPLWLSALGLTPHRPYGSISGALETGMLNCTVEVTASELGRLVAIHLSSLHRAVNVDLAVLIGLVRVAIPGLERTVDTDLSVLDAGIRVCRLRSRHVMTSCPHCSHDE
jgi:hypothetical protein